MSALLLDTNVISEAVRSNPDPQVAAFLERLRPEEQFTAAICLAEIYYGLDRMPAGKKQELLRLSVSRFMALAMPGRILAFDDQCAELYGQIRSTRERRGQPIMAQDAMIAATAQAHGLRLATRNTKDFALCGVSLVNPWKDV